LRYRAYGETRYTWGTTPTTFNFTGQRLDSSTNLLYYGARYYDPALGRFLSADTVVPEPGNPQALNRYAYVLNNPLKYIDPTGYVYDPSEGNGWQDTVHDHIVFVQGMITSGGIDEGFWAPYLEAMKPHLLNRIGDYNGDGAVDDYDWETWTTGKDPVSKRTYIQHVHYKAYGDFGTVEPGRVDLEGYVSRLSAGTGGAIYLFGHSAGGGAVLAFVLNPGAAAYTGHEVRAVSLDGAIDWVDTAWANRDYAAARKHGITAATVSNQLDVGNPGCAHGPIGSIPHFAYSYRGDCGGDPRCIHALVVQHPNAGGNWDPRNTNLWITPFQWTMRELGL